MTFEFKDITIKTICNTLLVFNTKNKHLMTVYGGQKFENIEFLKEIKEYLEREKGES